MEKKIAETQLEFLKESVIDAINSGCTSGGIEIETDEYYFVVNASFRRMRKAVYTENYLGMDYSVEEEDIRDFRIHGVDVIDLVTDMLYELDSEQVKEISKLY